MISWLGLLSALLAVVQLGLVVLLAPFLSGLRDFLGARLSGVPAPPLLRRWFLIVGQWRNSTSVPLSTDDWQNARAVGTDLAATLALALMLTGALLIPAFALGLPFAPLSDLLLIGLLLVLTRLACLFPALGGLAERASDGFFRMAALFLTLPAFFLVVALIFGAGATTRLDAVLMGLRHGSAFGDNAPFVLAATALLAVAGAEGGDVTSEVPAGRARAMLMLATDGLSLLWVTLAGALLWPSSLVIPADVAVFPGGIGIVLLAVVLWLLRCICLCILLASGRALAFGPVMAARLRAGGALLLALFALQLMLGMTPQPAGEEWPSALSGEGGRP